MKTIKVTQIYNNNGILAFEGESLATLQDYRLADRCEGSIFEAIHPGEVVALLDETLGERLLEIDADLELIDSDTMWYQRIDREPGAVDDEPCIMRVTYSDIPGEATQRDYFYEV